MHSDATLLKAFVSSGDESAFRRLVERHAPMVHGVAWRKTGNRTLAEEVTQTVFTILARKAAGLRHTELAGWLHRAAAMETRNASRKEQRRGKALQALNESMIPETNPEPVWNDISPHLDEAMTHLSAAERQAVVLRYFEQRSHREIAEATGCSEEASRKQIQRSLDRLGILLRRRGIATTGTALGAALSGQTLCMPPAAAAAVFATTALQAAPSLTAVTLFTHTLYTMTAHTIIKTAATTAVLAAIPVGFLWERNHSLRAEVQQLRAAAVPRVAVPVIMAPAPPAAAMTAAAKTAVPGSAGKSPAAAPEAGPNPLATFAGLFSGEGFVKIAEGQMKQDIAKDISRLSLRLNLTPEQKEKLQAYLEQKHGQEVEAFKKASEDGLLSKALRAPESITPEEKAKLEKLDLETKEVEDMDSFLKKLLSGDQMTEYVKSKEEQHAAKAEEKAQEMITALGSQLNLSIEQKDKLFEAIAARELARPQGEESTDAAAEKALAAIGEHGSGFNRETLVSEMTGSDKSHDDILREVLTPQQLTALESYRADEEKQTRAMVEALFPALAGGNAKAGEDKESK